MVYKKIKLSIALVFAFFLFSFPVFVSASEVSWLSTGDLPYKKYGITNLKPGEPKPEHMSGARNDCFYTEFIVRPERKLPLVPIYLQSEKRIEVCASKVNGGFFGNGYFLKNGTSVAGKVKSTISSRPYLIPIKNSSSLVELRRVGNYNEVYLVKNAYSNPEVRNDTWNGTTTYTLTTHTGKKLSLKNGEPLKAVRGSAAVSSNGNWMVLEATNAGIVRINLGSGAIHKVRGPYPYKPLGDLVEYAVSNDGRYVAAASYYNNFIHLYDSANCDDRGECEYRDIRQFLAQKEPAFAGGGNQLEFRGQNLHFVSGYNVKLDGSKTYAYFSVAPPGGEPNASKLDYLALGDSFAAGQGAFNYLPFTDTETNQCHLSSLSYPFLISNAQISRVESVACSGARIKDIAFTNLDEYRYYDPQDKSMLDSSYNQHILNNFLPGSRGQLLFVEDNAPKNLTISVVGNDIGFSDIIKKCIIYDITCYDSPASRAQLANIIENQTQKLVGLYADLKSNMAPGGKVYVIGYPQVAKVGGNCAVNVLLNAQEVQFAHNLIAYLNANIEVAANLAGVKYISTEDAFNGFRLCETDTNSVAVNALEGIKLDLIGQWNGFDYWKGFKGLGATNESFHPNEFGHRLFAATINKKTNGFTVEMPAPNQPDLTYLSAAYQNFVGETPDNTPVISNYYEDSLTDDFIFMNNTYTINLPTEEYSFQPGGLAELSIHSEPTTIDTYVADSDGNLVAEFTLPESIEPGVHTLHLKSKNIVGEEVDIQKIVYVADSPDDIDGDGVPNSQEKCLLVEPANIDSDQDGIDDACDGFISEPPAEPEDIGVVESPEVTPTTKVLPVSESRPQWLLDLEAEIQAQNRQDNQQQPPASLVSSDQGSETSQTSTSFSTSVLGESDDGPQATQTQDNQDTQPQTSSATAVRGIEETQANAKQPEPDQQSSTVSWIITLPLTIALLFTSYLIYRRYATQEQ